VAQLKKYDYPPNARVPVASSMREWPREPDAGSCGVRQAVAGMVVGEENRCIRIDEPDAWTVAFRGNHDGWQGQFQGQRRGQAAGA
jgi:hypothetical protein